MGALAAITVLVQHPFPSPGSEKNSGVPFFQAKGDKGGVYEARSLDE